MNDCKDQFSLLEKRVKREIKWCFEHPLCIRHILDDLIPLVLSSFQIGRYYYHNL